ARLEWPRAAAAEASLVDDAAIAASETQARAFWKIREDITEAQKLEAVSVKHDVSVPVSRVPELIEGAGVALAKRFPGVRIVAFGHVRDGNIHYNVCGPAGESAEAFFAKSPDVNRIVYDVVAALG